LRVLTRPYKEEKPRKPTVSQGLTLVHFSAQLERFVWDRGLRGGIVWRVLRGC